MGSNPTATAHTRRRFRRCEACGASPRCCFQPARPGETGRRGRHPIVERPHAAGAALRRGGRRRQLDATGRRADVPQPEPGRGSAHQGRRRPAGVMSSGSSSMRDTRLVLVVLTWVMVTPRGACTQRVVRPACHLVVRRLQDGCGGPPEGSTTGQNRAGGIPQQSSAAQAPRAHALDASDGRGAERYRWMVGARSAMRPSGGRSARPGSLSR